MLKSLLVENLAVTKSAHLEFEGGFCALTGETGAGKSMLVDALGVALGARADSSCVRDGESRALVAAAFDASPEARAWMSAKGIDCEEGEAILRRAVEAQGGSKAWINGVPVSVGELRELGGFLAAIHGQHESVALLRPKAQREHLDAFAGHSQLIDSVGKAHAGWAKAREAAALARREAEGRERERSQLAWEIEEISKVDPREGEWERLGEQHDRLSRAAEIREAFQDTVDEVDENEGSIRSRLSKMARRLSALPDPNARDVASALEQAAEIAADGARQLARALDHGEGSGGDERSIESRMGAFHETARKLRVAPSELPAKARQAQDRLAQLERGLDLAALDQQTQAARETLDQACAALSASRKEAAARLGAGATANLSRLGMGKARLEIVIEPKEPAADGADSIEFAMATRGAKSLPLAKCASGGELSRLGLALCAASASQRQPGCMIFDEVDAGIGGPTAAMVGQMLAELGSVGQTLAVTHLPQVAAMARLHYAVSKVEGPSGPSSSVAKAQGAARVAEIARMLGDAGSASAVAHAKELLGI
jgi:DNA repair protein RecN (Recombination protein N)